MGLSEHAARYRESTQTFLDAAAKVDAANADKHLPGEWSARQVLHHVADAETNSYIRLRRLVAEEPGTLIQGYDEGAWAKNPTLGYEDLPWEDALAVFRAVRASSAALIERLEESDLGRAGVHSESGPYTVADWLRIYTTHPLDHTGQLLEAIEHGD